MRGDPAYFLTPTLEFAPASSGTYYVAATSWSYLHPLGDYRLTATVREGADDYSADFSTTAQITSGATVSGKFEVAGDVDWIKFHADAGGHYSLRAHIAPVGQEPNVIPSEMLVYDKSGQLVSHAGSFDPGESGDYYFSVLGLKEGNYTLALRTETDDYSDSLLRMGTIAIGGKATGKIEYRIDQDRFKLPAVEAGKIYTVTLTGDAAAFELGVMDADSYTLASTSGNPGSGSVTLTFSPKTSGDAYILVGTDIFSTFKNVLNYALSVSAPDADDIGDTPASAAQLTVGQAASGTLQLRGDVDLFKATLEAGVTYSVALSGEKVDASAVKITITGADGNTYTVSSSALKYATFTPMRSGEYYAAISSEAGVVADVAYQLILDKPADDAGASVASARALAIGATLSGVLEAGGGDRDWYAVKLDAGGTYWFKAESASSTLTTGGALRLLDASGTELAAAGYNYGSLTDTLAFKVAQSGTYYVEMYSPNRNTGAYTITAKAGQADDYGSTVSTAAAIAPGSQLAGQLEVALDKDVFKLDVEAGRSYAFKFSVPAYAHSFSFGLADGTGRAMYFLSNTAMPADQNVFVATVTGSVYLTVAGAYGASDYNRDGRSYTLSAADFGVDDSGQTIDTAKPLAIGTPHQGRIDYAGDRDMFRMSLEAGKSYVFSLPGNTVNDGAFELLDANGMRVGTSLYAALEQRISYTASKAGDFFLYMYGASNATGTYSLKATQLTGDTVGPSLVSSSQADGAINVAQTDISFKMVFNEAIAIDAAAIRVLDGAGKPLPFANSYRVDGMPHVRDNTLEFTLASNLAPGSTYTIELPRGAIHDLAGNAHSGPELIRFTTTATTVNGTAGNDVILGGSGVAINGGAGLDTVLYAGSGFSHTISRVGSKVEVKSTVNGVQIIDTLEQVERLAFNSTRVALDIDGIGGQAYRLYRAAFDRAPDQGGIGFWIAQMDKGLALDSVASHFVASSEFQSLYGAALSNSDFIKLLYNNVLDRAPDVDGFNFWDNAMRNGYSREQVLVYFSDSAENVAAVASVIGNGFSYTPY